jgi:hypothetical protein
MNGTPPIVQTEHVDECMARVYISFTVPTRYVDYGQLPIGAPHPMVAIATVGSTSPIRLTPREDCHGELSTTALE